MKTVVCFGDSLTYGYGVLPDQVWHQQIKKHFGIRILNRGRNGDSLLGMQIRLFRDVLDSSADFCFFMAGSNDLMMGESPEEVFNNIKKIENSISKKNIKTIILSPPPAIPEMAKISWDFSPDYEIFNKSLEELSHRLNDEFSERFINIFGNFMNIAFAEREKLYLDGIHLNERGNKLIGEIIKTKKLE